MNQEREAQKDSIGRYSLTRWLYVRCISIVYLIAFFSVYVQIDALYGSSGILPVRGLLPTHQPLDMGNVFIAPTVFWFGTDDWIVNAVPLIGMICSAIALLGIFVGPMLFIAWFLYLSIITVGQTFMSFQWDILLLEIGFLTIFLSPWRPFDSSWSRLFERLKFPEFLIDRSEAPASMIWLSRWLLFRLMFASGMVKILSGDVNWHNLTAMSYHYETQPLPTPLAYFANLLPGWFQKFSTACVFFIELFVPFFVFAPRKLRFVAFSLLALLQILIILTGNYCFFNILTLSLCVLLLDDKAILSVYRLLPDTFRTLVGTHLNFIRPVLYTRQPSVNWSRLRMLFLVPVLAVIGTISVSDTLMQYGLMRMSPLPIAMLYSLVQPYRLVSSYGLFAVMTTERPEIIIEGSLDGKDWKEYEFRYKAGPLDRPPPIVAPHQPRIDWQLWFAAMSDAFSQRWFLSFIEKLSRNDSTVLSQLANNPFPKSGPSYLKASIYDYQFTDLDTLMKTGRWWKREYVRPYLPVLRCRKGVAEPHDDDEIGETEHSVQLQF